MTTLESAEGDLLGAVIAEDQQWRFPASDSIPQKFETALLLFEDEYFYYHVGVNPVSIFRAIHQNFLAGRIVSGGSTISMQTVRMAYGNQKRTYPQKFLELLAALKLELYYSKKEILQQYADHAPFGGNIIGLKAASYRYFGRPAHKLSWAETAMLAVLPNNPASIFPGKNQERLKEKRDQLLHKLNERGFLSQDELYLAKQEQLPSSPKPLPQLAYHLLRRGINEGHKGSNIKSTLQTYLQKEASRKLNRYSRKMKYNQVHNAAAIILDISSGNTLAYVGNTSSTMGDHGQHVDIITSRRSPGSLLKPILYAAALDEGLMMPKQLLPDKPLFYKGFTPRNFDKAYRGMVPADDALVSSLNVPFVHLLIEYGHEKFHQKLQEVGFTHFNQPADHYGLSMILGGGETSLWEISAVYASMVRAFQNYTERPLHKWYAQEDYHPNYYTPTTPKNEQLSKDGPLRVLSIRYALEAMQRVERPDQEAGWKYYGSARNIAWKTGTSFGHRDAWAIGVNGKYLVGVWIGNADGEGRPGLTGVSAAAPLMFDLFSLVQGSLELEEYYGEEIMVCKQSGMLASKNCPDAYPMQLETYMTKGNQCQYHKVLHLNKEATHQVNSSCYAIGEMVNQEWFILPPVEAWYYQRFHPEYKNVPPFLSHCKQTDSKTYFDLIYPHSYRKVHIPIDQEGQRGHAVFEAAHEDASTNIYWHIDNQYLGSTKSTHQIAVQAPKGVHLLTLVDDLGNEIKQEFEVVD
ncbi:penicillin-binding protein 1C [Algivirga pacifica]|uniref:peptidoglycan glycosyltransferase n=1 Tax=Algivirga pacifica TaxID=1162670 RepID=A0ABP9DKP3_9BACT